MTEEVEPVKIKSIQPRLFTAKKNGVVVRQGTFLDLDLLKMDLPSSEYELILDEHLPYPVVNTTYAEQRAMAYPPVSELGDALYWQTKGDNSKIEAYLAKCEAVKAQYPKPVA
jgi:hypothetical protein